jgi:hypothetical protein
MASQSLQNTRQANRRWARMKPMHIKFRDLEFVAYQQSLEFSQFLRIPNQP